MIDGIIKCSFNICITIFVFENVLEAIIAAIRYHQRNCGEFADRKLYEKSRRKYLACWRIEFPPFQEEQILP